MLILKKTNDSVSKGHLPLTCGSNTYNARPFTYLNCPTNMLHLKFIPIVEKTLLKKFCIILYTLIFRLLFVECSDGYFGPNCREACNETCKSCNKTSGVCEYGCKPGWKGDFCETSNNNII